MNGLTPTMMIVDEGPSLDKMLKNMPHPDGSRADRRKKEKERRKQETKLRQSLIKKHQTVLKIGSSLDLESIPLKAVILKEGESL